MAGELRNSERLLATALEQLGECGARGSQCRVLRVLLDEFLREMGPWKLAHLLVTSDYPEAVESLLTLLQNEAPYESSLIDRLITASRWEQESAELMRDFGAV